MPTTPYFLTHKSIYCKEYMDHSWSTLHSKLEGLPEEYQNRLKLISAQIKRITSAFNNNLEQYPLSFHNKINFKETLVYYMMCDAEPELINALCLAADEYPALLDFCNDLQLEKFWYKQCQRLSIPVHGPSFFSVMRFFLGNLLEEFKDVQNDFVDRLSARIGLYSKQIESEARSSYS